MGKASLASLSTNDLRRHSMDFNDRQKIKAIDFMVEEASKKTRTKKVAQLCSMYDTEEFDDVARLT